MLNTALAIREYSADVTLGRGFSSEKKILAPAIRNAMRNRFASINIWAIDKFAKNLSIAQMILDIRITTLDIHSNNADMAQYPDITYHANTLSDK